MNLKDIMLSETNQTEKDKYCVSPLYEVPRAAKFRDRMTARGWQEGGNRELLFNEHSFNSARCGLRDTWA